MTVSQLIEPFIRNRKAAFHTLHLEGKLSDKKCFKVDVLRLSVLHKPDQGRGSAHNFLHSDSLEDF